MKIKQRFKDEIHWLLDGQPHLKPMFTSVHCIPERVHEYDSSFFIVFNTKLQRYEIHCTEHFPSTHAVTIPFNELDARTIQHLWYNDLRAQGDKVLKRATQFEEKLAKEKEREEKNYLESAVREMKSEFAKSAWLGGT